MRSEHREEIRRDDLRWDLLRFLAVVVVDLVERHRGQVGQRVGLRAQVLEVEMRDGEIPRIPLIRRRHDDERRGIGNRQRAEQHGVDQAEDRRVRADAERERQNRDRAEARALPEHPDGVFEVLKKHVSRQ